MKSEKANPLPTVYEALRGEIVYQGFIPSPISIFFKRGRIGEVAPIVDRILCDDILNPGDQCVAWGGSHTTAGYANVGTCHEIGVYKVEYVHRLVYQELIGPIPKGYQVDHRCHNLDLTCAGGSVCSHRGCLNPFHLEAVTQQVNLRRSRLHRELVKAMAS